MYVRKGILKQMGVKEQRRIYHVYIVLILGSILGYGISEICSFTLFPDEFGYWASAAELAGYDWKDMTSLGSYYSFGYGFLLFPVLKFATDGITAYQIAIGMNMVFMCIAIWLIQGIIKELFPKADEVKRILSAGIAVLYPSWIFYMQMTLTEALLMFLFVLLVRVCLSFWKNPGKGKALCIAVIAVYMYCVHMRSLGVVLACMIALLITLFQKKESRNSVIWCLCGLVLGFVLAAILKQWAVEEVFVKTNAEWLNTNDYGGVCKKLQELFTGKGFYYFFAGILGKVLYLQTATFGLFYWAVVWCIGKVKRMIKGENKNGNEFVKGMAAFFLLLSLSFEIMLCAVYLAKDQTIDSLVYGRYIEFLIPVFMCVGVIVPKKKILSRGAALGTVTGIIAVLLTVLVEKEKREGLRGYMVVGISHFINETDFVPWKYFFQIWLFGMVMFLFIAVISRLAEQDNNKSWLLSFILVVEVVAGLYACERFIYRYNEVHFEDRMIVERIQQQISEGEQIFYLKEDGSRYIQAIQMMLKEKTVRMITKEEFLQQDTNSRDYVITVKWSEFGTLLEEKYGNIVKTNTFILYY